MSKESANKKFSMGQIVFILSNKNEAVIPAMVVEETIVKTLNGERVSWKLAVGPKTGQQKIVNSHDVNGEIYDSLDNIKKSMEKNLMSFLNKMVSDTEKRTRLWYGDVAKSTPNQVQSHEVSRKVDTADLLSGFEDLPLEQMQEHAQREHLKSLVVPDNNDYDDEIPPVEHVERNKNIQTRQQHDNAATITGPNGETYKVII